MKTKGKVFYDHLISFHEVVRVIESYELDEIEKEEIIGLADQIYHHRTLEIILKHLPSDKHLEFLEAFYAEPGHEKHLHYLKKHKEDIEQKITDESEKVKREILAEIKRSEKR